MATMQYIAAMHYMAAMHAHKPRPQSPIGDLGDVAGQNGKRLCRGGKPGTGKLNTYMWLRPHKWGRGQWPWGYGGVLNYYLQVSL